MTLLCPWHAWTIDAGCLHVTSVPFRSPPSLASPHPEPPSTSSSLGGSLNLVRRWIFPSRGHLMRQLPRIARETAFAPLEGDTVQLPWLEVVLRYTWRRAVPGKKGAVEKGWLSLGRPQPAAMDRDACSGTELRSGFLQSVSGFFHTCRINSSVLVAFILPILIALVLP